MVFIAQLKGLKKDKGERRKEKGGGKGKEWKRRGKHGEEGE